MNVTSSSRRMKKAISQVGMLCMRWEGDSDELTALLFGWEYYDYKSIRRKEATVTQCRSLEAKCVGVADINGVICEWMDGWIQPAAAPKAAPASLRNCPGLSFLIAVFNSDWILHQVHEIIETFECFSFSSNSTASMISTHGKEN